MKATEYAEYDINPNRGAGMPTITQPMIDAAQRVLIRRALAEDLGIKPADVTDEAVEVELAEGRAADEADLKDDPELPTLDEVFAEMLTAALAVAEVSA